MTKAAGGLQDSHDEIIQQQTAEFSKLVASAQDRMQEQVEQFQELVTAATERLMPKKPVYEAKVIDGGLWLNKDATDALMQVIEGMSALLQELDKK